MSDPDRGADLFDHLMLVRMDWLTLISKQILPHGYWGEAKKAQDESKPKLYLTFDDGPVPETTTALLDLMDEEDARATFFVLGRRAQKYPGLIADIVRRGHTIGNHSFSHQFMPAMPTKIIEHEIHETNLSIAEAAGNAPVLFRPPYGLMDRRAADCLKERNMTPVYWGAVSEDWLGVGEKRVVERTMSRLKHGTLIVLHEGRLIAGQTLAATRKIIRRSKALGYHFATIDV